MYTRHGTTGGYTGLSLLSCSRLLGPPSPPALGSSALLSPVFKDSSERLRVIKDSSEKLRVIKDSSGHQGGFKDSSGHQGGFKDSSERFETLMTVLRGLIH